MKTCKLLSYTLLIALLGFLFTGCSDNDDDIKVVNISVYKDQLISGEGSAKTIRFKDNLTMKLNVHIMPTDAKNKGLIFRMMGSSVASVSSDGLITPIALGKDTLIIEATDGSGAYVKYPVEIVTHLVKITSIVLTADAQNVKVGKGKQYNLSDKFKINPDDAFERKVSYISSDESVLTVDQNGLVTGVDYGEATVTIAATDGSGVTATANFTIAEKVIRYEPYNRTDWIATASHALPAEGGKNKASALIDGDLTDAVAFLSMVKPGFSMEGTTVGAEEEAFFTIDMKKSQEVTYFRYYHRHSLAILRFFAVTIKGSNDGKSFTTVAENVVLPGASKGGNDTKDSGVIDIPSSTYRYYKIIFADWDKVSAEVGQISEFYLGYTIEE